MQNARVECKRIGSVFVFFLIILLSSVLLLYYALNKFVLNLVTKFFFELLMNQFHINLSNIPNIAILYMISLLLMCVSLHHHLTKNLLALSLHFHFALYTCYHFKQHRTNEHKSPKQQQQ